MNIIDLPTTESAIRESYEMSMKMAPNFDFEPTSNPSCPESPQSSCDDCCSHGPSSALEDCLECNDSDSSKWFLSEQDCMQCVEAEKDHQNGVSSILDDLLEGDQHQHHHQKSSSNHKNHCHDHDQDFDGSLYCHWDDHLHSHYEMKFNSQMELDNHLRNVHDVYNNHACQWDSCETSASTLDDILAHIRRDHLPQGDQSCPSNTHNSHQQQQQQTKSTSEEINPSMTPNEVLQCHYNNCEFKANDPYSLNTHMNNYHQVNSQQSIPTPNHTPMDSTGVSHVNPYHCEWSTCTFESKYYDDIVSHVQAVHNNNKTLTQLPSPKSEEQQQNVLHVCHWVLEDGSECLKSHSSTQDLSDHIIDNHVGSKKNEYKCLWKGCERECRPFRQRQKIIRHLQTHSKNRPFKCAVCGNAFAEMAVLKQHMRVHSGEKPYACKLCGKRFAASTALSVHIRTHTGEKPLACKYPGCGKRFAESSNLTKHMKTHYKGKSAVCSVEGCGKSFGRGEQLNRHMKVHEE